MAAARAASPKGGAGISVKAMSSSMHQGLLWSTISIALTISGAERTSPTLEPRVAARTRRRGVILVSRRGLVAFAAYHHETGDVSLGRALNFLPVPRAVEEPEAYSPQGAQQE